MPASAPKIGISSRPFEIISRKSAIDSFEPAVTISMPLRFGIFLRREFMSVAVSMKLSISLESISITSMSAESK